jgi:hypothetical protein
MGWSKWRDLNIKYLKLLHLQETVFLKSLVDTWNIKLEGRMA